jgi:hypothetical protein
MYEFVQSDDYVVTLISGIGHEMFLVKDTDLNVLRLVDPNGFGSGVGGMPSTFDVEIQKMLQEKLRIANAHKMSKYTNVLFKIYQGDQGLEGHCVYASLFRALTIALLSAGTHQHANPAKLLGEPISCVLVTFVTIVTQMFQVNDGSIPDQANAVTSLIGLSPDSTILESSAYTGKPHTPPSDIIQTLYTEIYNIHNDMTVLLQELQFPTSETRKKEITDRIHDLTLAYNKVRDKYYTQLISERERVRREEDSLRLSNKSIPYTSYIFTPSTNTTDEINLKIDNEFVYIVPNPTSNPATRGVHDG